MDVYEPAVTDALHSNAMTSPHTHYDYDAGGNEVRQTDAKGNATVWTFDANGNELSRTLPDGERESFTYNVYGQVATHTDFDGNAATNAYATAGTRAGMLQSTTYAGAAGSGKATQTVSYIYDALNRPLTTVDASGTTTDSYDGQGNLVEQQTPEGTVWYVFDPKTGLHTETYTDYTQTFYGYNTRGQLTSVSVQTRTTTGGTWSVPATTGYAYDGVGNKLTESPPNGVVTTYRYDDLNRLTGQTTVNAGGAPLSAESFTLNPDGTRASAVETQLQADGSTLTLRYAWAYDADGRMTGESLAAAGNTTLSNTSAAAMDYSDAYAFDLDGNRLTDVHAGPGDGAPGTTTYTYNGDDQLTRQAPRPTAPPSSPTTPTEVS